MEDKKLITELMSGILLLQLLLQSVIFCFAASALYVGSANGGPSYSSLFIVFQPLLIALGLVPLIYFYRLRNHQKIAMLLLVNLLTLLALGAHAYIGYHANANLVQ